MGYKNTDFYKFSVLRDYKNISGIYCWTNLVNGKKYVGQTTNLSRRPFFHISDTSKSLISEAVRKYGIENFSLEILEFCEIDKLNDREIYWISELNSYKNGYNATLGGDHNPMLLPEIREKVTGDNSYIRRMSPEEREEWLKDNLRGENNPMYGVFLSGDKHFMSKKTSEERAQWIEDHRLGENNPFYGHKHTDQAKELMSKNCAMKRPEVVSKISGENHYNYGKSLSDDIKLKISKKSSGENNPFYGKQHSNETRKLLSKLTSEQNSNGRSTLKRGNKGWITKTSKRLGISREEVIRRYEVGEI